MSTEQRETLDAILRQSAFPVGSDVDEQRRLLRELVSAQPLPAEVTVTASGLGGVPTAEITVDGIEPRHVVLYFHGGVYVIGDAFLAADLASQVGRRTHAKTISVDYRLAPEHPYPAAVDDALAAYEALLQNGTAPSDIAFAGESAGGGLAIATLVNARDHGLPLPAAAYVMSPYVDLTLAGTSMETRREVDPLLSRELLQARVADYTSGQDAALGLISPVFADLSGLPPLIIQAGTHEVLLDDAVRLAQQAATADVEVTLEITPGVPHVFQAYHPILDEAAAALDRAGQLLSAHLADAARVTGGILRRSRRRAAPYARRATSEARATAERGGRVCVDSSFPQQPLVEHDLDDLRHRLEAVPVSLQLAGERDPAARDASGLDDTLDAGAMRLHGRAADRVDDGIDLVALPQRVDRSERHADLRPERAEDELAPAGGMHGGHEVPVLPRVDARAVDRRVVLEQLGQLGDGRLLLAGCDVDGRVDDRQPERLRGLDGRDDVLQQQVRSIERTVAN